MPKGIFLSKASLKLFAGSVEVPLKKSISTEVSTKIIVAKPVEIPTITARKTSNGIMINPVFNNFSPMSWFLLDFRI